MEAGAPTTNEVLVLASLALVFGTFWHWMGWMKWPTQEPRKPLGRMVSYDAPIAVAVYVVSLLGTSVVAGVYIVLREKGLLEPLIMPIPTTVPADVAATLPATMPEAVAETSPSIHGTPLIPVQTTDKMNFTLSIAEVLVIHFLSCLPLVAYFLIRCIPAKDAPDRQTGLEFKGFGKLMLGGLVVGLTAMPLILLINVGAIELAYRLLEVPRPTDGHDLLMQLRTDPTAWNYFLVSVLVVFMAPVVEEVFFRGVIQGSLRELGRPTAVFVSAALFALVHLGSAPWQVLPAMALLGVMLGLLFEKTGVLWPNIFAHAAFNAGNVLLSLLYVNHSP